MSIIVIALGGNALGSNPKEQKELLKKPAQKIAYLVKQGHNVLIGHGNGPQVGMIVNAFAKAKEGDSATLIIPFPEAGGMSQGYIGFHMLTAIANQFIVEGIKKMPAYLLTQTIVDKNDPAFQKPSKPVGPFYKTFAEADQANPDSTIIEDAGRGYRKVVASPQPLDFIGLDVFKKNIKAGHTIIVGGGGGIPTIINDQGLYEGVDGVIDKDFALSALANSVKADLFIILTAVEKVYLSYGSKDEKALDKVSISELKQYIQEEHFAPGSMLPKVQAAIKFVEGHKKRQAIIASLDKLEDALEHKSGTRIVL